jgi:DNA-binding transcriptional ArsR family regulator
MTNVASLAGVAALIGDPARASMLVTLMDGRALTAGELGEAAGVAASTASGHLGQMLEAGLLALHVQGRHRYYRLAGRSVAAMLESMMALSGELAEAANRSRPVRTGPRDKALRHARICYDHLAGEVAVGIADAMIARGQLDLGSEGAAITDSGAAFLTGLGVDLVEPKAGGASFCRPCIDWSERRPHLAGVVGRGLYRTMLDRNWARRAGDGRAVTITPLGTLELRKNFGLSFDGGT